MNNDAKALAIAKLYERIAKGEQLTDKEYEFINNYEILCTLNKPKSNVEDISKIIKIVDKIFPKS